MTQLWPIKIHSEMTKIVGKKEGVNWVLNTMYSVYILETTFFRHLNIMITIFFWWRHQVNFNSGFFIQREEETLKLAMISYREHLNTIIANKIHFLHKRKILLSANLNKNLHEMIKYGKYYMKMNAGHMWTAEKVLIHAGLLIYKNNIMQNIVKILQNWKAPGRNAIHNCWFKFLTSLHEVIFISIICRNNPKLLLSFLLFFLLYCYTLHYFIVNSPLYLIFVLNTWFSEYFS